MATDDQYKAIKRKDGDYIFKSINGDLAQDTDQYGVIFIVRHPIEVLRVDQVHAVASTGGGVVALDVEKLTGTTAPGGGTSILGSTFDLTGTANTVVTRESSDLATDRQFVEGDRIGLVDTGTLTSLEDVCVTIYFKRLGQGDYL